MRPSRTHETGGSAAPDPIPPITEKQLALLWQRRAARSSAFRTERGARIRVLYPGRPGVTAGPDFRDALLAVEGHGLVQGDVEIHLRQRDWRSHGHHHDPNYNGVVLHVTLETGGEPSRTDGGFVPEVVNLEDMLRDGQQGHAGTEQTRDTLWRVLSYHGYSRPQGLDQMAAILNRAGDERFLSHSRRLQTLMSAQSPEQTLWEGICDALGYRHNRHPFVMLANAAPIAALADSAVRLPVDRRRDTMTEWLLRLAGFEHGPVPAGLGPPLDAEAWRLFRVRPSNHPRRRIAGAAAILDRHIEPGFVGGLLAAARVGDPKTVAQSLTVASNDRKPAPIGEPRARDIAVNVVLPFLHGYRSRAGDPHGAAHMLDLYRSFGRLTDNEITRQLESALQAKEWGRVATNARRQQGLIHLQRLLAGGI